jgi:hypothetical protein
MERAAFIVLSIAVGLGVANIVLGRRRGDSTQETRARVKLLNLAVLSSIPAVMFHGIGQVERSLALGVQVAFAVALLGHVVRGLREEWARRAAPRGP